MVSNNAKPIGVKMMKNADIIEAIEIVRDSIMDYNGAMSENERNGAIKIIIEWSERLLNIKEPKNPILADRLCAMIRYSQNFLYRREQAMLEAM